MKLERKVHYLKRGKKKKDGDIVLAGLPELNLLT